MQNNFVELRLAKFKFLLNSVSSLLSELAFKLPTTTLAHESLALSAYLEVPILKYASSIVQRILKLKWITKKIECFPIEAVKHFFHKCAAPRFENFFKAFKSKFIVYAVLYEQREILNIIANLSMPTEIHWPSPLKSHLTPKPCLTDSTPPHNPSSAQADHVNLIIFFLALLFWKFYSFFQWTWLIANPYLTLQFFR